VRLPNDFGAAFGREPFNGAVWFRRRVKVPAAWKGRPLELGLGEIDKSDVAFADGVRVGGLGCDTDPTYYDVPRVYPVTAADDELVVAVRVWSYGAGAGVYGDKSEMFLRLRDEPSKTIPLGGTWRGKVERDIGARDLPDLPPAPASLFNAMIAPLVSTAIRGVLWYQGCSNSGDGGANYRAMQNALVSDWRRRWRDDALPFGFVVLAGCGRRTDYDAARGCGIRAEQALTALDLAHVGCVSAQDVGDESDIHPKDKRTVGERLATWALGEAYGRKGTFGSPLRLSARADGNRLVVRFANAGKGLRAKGGGQKVSGCFLAGADGVYRPAEAEASGDTLTVTSPQVAAPRFVRYAWAGFPKSADLVNDALLPAPPFELTAAEAEEKK